MAVPTAVEARSSGGYSRPSAGVPRTPSASGGYARPRTPSFSQPDQRTPSPSDQAFSRRGSAEALETYRSRQQQSPLEPGGRAPADRPYTATPGYGAPGYGGWAPPAYAYRGPRSFGAWDAVFLWFLLDTLNRPGHAQFFHDHEDDPAYRQWRAEADRQAEDHPELRDKLGQLDQRLAQQADQPRNPGAPPPDAVPASPRQATGGSLWGLIAILAAALVLLWWWRRPRLASQSKGNGMARWFGNFLSRKVGGEPYRPSLFRVGMTLSIDPAPFILAAKVVKVAPPATGAGNLVSVAAVGTVAADGVTLYRLYLPQSGFFQLHLDDAGHPDECRYFSILDEIVPADADEWGFWLDSREGAIGWPEFQTKDGKVYGRAWSPGSSRIPPRTLKETIITASGTVTAVHQAILYAAPSGAPSPAPPTEYILVAAIEQQAQAWVRVAAGMDVNPASLSLA